MAEQHYFQPLSTWRLSLRPLAFTFPERSRCHLYKLASWFDKTVARGGTARASILLRTITTKLDFSP